MQSKLVWENAGERTFVLVLDAGEEAFAAMPTSPPVPPRRRVADGARRLRARDRRLVRPRQEDLPADRDRQQCEGLSLLGDIATGDDGKPSLHMHAVLGLRDGTTRGGHFLKGIVRPTLEVTIVETPARLRRRKRPELGIALIDLSKS